MSPFIVKSNSYLNYRRFRYAGANHDEPQRDKKVRNHTKALDRAPTA